MEMTKYIEQKNNLIAGNRLLKLAVVIVGFGLVINAFITYSLSKRARTIIVPPVDQHEIRALGLQALG